MGFRPTFGWHVLMWCDCTTHKTEYICLEQGKSLGQWSQISVSVKQHQCLSLSLWVTMIQGSLPCTYTHIHTATQTHTHTYRGAQRLCVGTAVLLWHTAYTPHHIRYTDTPYPQTCGPQWHTDTVACFTKCWHTLLGILYCQVTFTRYTLTHIAMYSIVLQYSESIRSKMEVSSTVQMQKWRYSRRRIKQNDNVYNEMIEILL